MNEVLRIISFENIDGGAWRQGWDIRLPPEKENLQVSTLLQCVLLHYNYIVGVCGSTFTQRSWLVTHL